MIPFMKTTSLQKEGIHPASHRDQLMHTQHPAAMGLALEQLTHPGMGFWRAHGLLWCDSTAHSWGVWAPDNYLF